MAITNKGTIFTNFDTTSNSSTLSFGNTSRTIQVGELVIVATASKRTSSGVLALMNSITLGSTGATFTFVQNTTWTGSSSTSTAYAGLSVGYWLADQVVASGTSVSASASTTGQSIAAIGFSVSGADLSRAPVSAIKTAAASQTPQLAVTPGLANCGGIAFLNYRQDFGTGEVFPTNCINTPLTLTDDFGFINRQTTTGAEKQLEIMGGNNIGTATSKTLGASSATTRTVGVTVITFAPVVESEPAINLL